MVRTYRKAGETIRVEQNRGTLSFLHISEHGQAEEDEEGFTCQATTGSLSLPAPDRNEVHRFVRRLQTATAGVEVERMTLLSGRAAHQFRARSEQREWNETFARLHLSIVNRPARFRVTVDLGGPALADIDLGIVDLVVSASKQLVRAEPIETALLLRPHVAAALWHALVLGVDPVNPPKATLRIDQSTHETFRRDGDGLRIEPILCLDFGIRKDGVARPWPNRYRPSYRSRPIPMPFHLRARAKGNGIGAEIEAIALVDPFEIADGGIAATLLCRQGKTREGFIAGLSGPLEEFLGRIRFIGEKGDWFPYGAGAYGTEVELEPL
jgi:hypothetical protein